MSACSSPGRPGFRAWARVYEQIERFRLDRPVHLFEQAVKVPLYDCRDCGDCSLPDIAYLCPECHCQKNQRNGPCGGAIDGMCEVPGHTCVWADAYRRLKPYGEERRMLERPVVVQDNGLRRTSAWGNTFLGRDHYARRERQLAVLDAPPADAALTPTDPRPERTPLVKPDRTGTPFQVVGENIHATRVLKRAGKHAAELEDGTVGIAFEAADGARARPAGPSGPGREPRLRRRQDQARRQRHPLGPRRRPPGGDGGRLRPDARPPPGGDRRRLAGPQRRRDLGRCRACAPRRSPGS